MGVARAEHVSIREELGVDVVLAVEEALAHLERKRGGIDDTTTRGGVARPVSEGLPVLRERGDGLCVCIRSIVLIPVGASAV